MNYLSRADQTALKGEVSDGRSRAFDPVVPATVQKQKGEKTVKKDWASWNEQHGGKVLDAAATAAKHVRGGASVNEAVGIASKEHGVPAEHIHSMDSEYGHVTDAVKQRK